MKRTALYVRVSTTGKGQTTENQQLDLIKCCEQRGFCDPLIFDDSGISGAKESRPQLDKLMAMVKKRRTGHPQH